jgi:hypothetical protein
MVLSMAPVEKLLQPVHSSLTTGSLPRHMRCATHNEVAQTTKQRQKQSDAHVCTASLTEGVSQLLGFQWQTRTVAFIARW